MRNLKQKFIKDINNEIEDAYENIGRYKLQLESIPIYIKQVELQIENLKGLLVSVEADQHFTDPVFSYEEEYD